MLSILKLVLSERNKKGASTVLEGLSTQEMKELCSLFVQLRTQRGLLQFFIILMLNWKEDMSRFAFVHIRTQCFFT